MVYFPGSYHAILGRPSYAKFMAIPNYTYLKLKMPGPNGDITLATAVINLSELLWLRESSTLAVPDCNKPASSMAFCPLEETKAVGINPTDPTKMVRIGT